MRKVYLETNNYLYEQFKYTNTKLYNKSNKLAKLLNIKFDIIGDIP